MWRGTFKQRLVQYTLLFGAITPLKVLRATVPSFVPLLVSEFGFTQAQTAALLSGFFPGYMCSMVPGAAITAACGAKAVMTAAMAGSAAIFYLMPTVAQHYGAGALSALLTALGVIQGPLSAVNTQMRKEWVPTEKGYENERIWQLRSVSIAMQSTDLTAALVVPYLYARGSFSYACRWLATATAAVCCVWQLFAKARPSGLPGTPTSPSGDASKPGATRQKAVEWGIFRVPATWAMFTYGNAIISSIAKSLPTLPSMFSASFDWARCSSVLPECTSHALTLLHDNYCGAATGSRTGQCTTQWHNGHPPTSSGSLVNFTSLDHLSNPPCLITTIYCAVKLKPLVDFAH